MSKPKPDYSFWTKYKKFAGNEIMLYIVMVVGIVLGIIIVSYFKGWLLLFQREGVAVGFVNGLIKIHQVCVHVFIKCPIVQL